MVSTVITFQFQRHHKTSDFHIEFGHFSGLFELKIIFFNRV